MARCVARRVQQRQARQQFGVAVYQAPTSIREVPMMAGLRKPFVAAASDREMFALDNEFGLREMIVEAHVVRVEVCANYGIDVRGTQIEFGQVIEDGALVTRWRHVRGFRVVGRNAAVDEDVPLIGGLNQVAAGAHLKRAVFG